MDIKELVNKLSERVKNEKQLLNHDLLINKDDDHWKENPNEYEAVLRKTYDDIEIHTSALKYIQELEKNAKDLVKLLKLEINWPGMDSDDTSISCGNFDPYNDDLVNLVCKFS